MKDFREIDHSGDVGIEARGPDVATLLANATRGLFSLQYRGSVEPVVERPIEVTSESIENLLVDWLSEIIAIGGVRGERYGEVDVAHASETSAGGVLRGESYDERKHAPRLDVKAATYHDLEVATRRDGWRARVIFDL
jgi:SHS2 domain-containing protein